MSGIEVFLDETPGDTRGVILRNGRAEHLLIEREDDVAAHRLGARIVGRVTGVAPALGGAFVDIGTAVEGFLPFRRDQPARVGEGLEAEVTAEPRGGKGVVLKRVGAGEGKPGLLKAGPSVRETLSALAAGAMLVEGVAAIRAALDAEDEALEPQLVLKDVGLDLMLERTRAMATADFDWAPGAGLAVGTKARDRANRAGLVETARLLGLKRWGGLAAIDLIGAGLDGEAIARTAKEAFRAPGVSIGPVNRFGVLQLTLPWSRTPIEELFRGARGERPMAVRATDLTRALRRTLLTDTTRPRIVARCAPDLAEAAASLVARLGPRAGLATDAALAPGDYMLDEE